MKFGMLAAAAIALSALIPSGPAYAQPTCKDIKDILAEAPNSFHAFQGEETDTDYFDSEFWLKNAVECSIDVASADVFFCIWANAVPAMETFYDGLTMQVTACLPGWRALDAKGRIGVSGKPIDKGLKFDAGVGDKSNIYILAWLAPRDDKQTSEVWLQVVHY